MDGNVELGLDPGNGNEKDNTFSLRSRFRRSKAQNALLGKGLPFRCRRKVIFIDVYLRLFAPFAGMPTNNKFIFCHVSQPGSIGFRQRFGRITKLIPSNLYPSINWNVVDKILFFRARIILI